MIRRAAVRPTGVDSMPRATPASGRIPVRRPPGSGRHARRTCRASHGVVRVSSVPPAKFFVNQGLVTSPVDMHHLLRPLLRQTVAYRFYRSRELVAHGIGWVERIVMDEPRMSTFFTPISITLNVDSFEHLEFETRPDQLLVYTLAQGDEKVVIEFVPGMPGIEAGPDTPRQLAFDTSGFVQMELLGPVAAED